MAQSLLSGAVDASAAQSKPEDTIRQLREELALERAKRQVLEEGLGSLRSVLTPLYRGLAAVFGELDVLPGAQADVSLSGPNDRTSAVWDSWKSKLGGYSAKAIDALLLHGSMTQAQLRIHVGCATSSVPNIVMALNKAGLIEKDGKKVRLKQL